MKPVKSLTFGGIIAGLFTVVSLLLRFELVIGLDVIVLFFVPFFAAYYSYKTKSLDKLILFVSTMLISLLIDWTNALLYILPSLSVGIIYGQLVKENYNGYSLIFILTIAEFGLNMFANVIIKLITGLSMIETFNSLFLLATDSKYLALGILLAYCFIQSVLIHFILRKELKKMKVEVNNDKQIPIWLIVVSLVFIVASFFNYTEPMFSFFIAVAAVVFGFPVVLYGYQNCDKLWILLIVQTVFFLGGSLPMLLVLKDYAAIGAYILMFLPVVGYAIYTTALELKKKKESK